MTGKNKGTIKSSCQFHGHVAGICIMTVKNIRDMLLFFYKLDCFINEFLKMGPEQFFANISAASAPDANNTHFVAKWLYLPAVIRGNGLILDKAGKQVHLIDIIPLGKGSGKFQDILYLTTRIGIPPKFG